jgi:hypothetical protein
VVLLKADTTLRSVLIRASAGSTTIVDSIRFVRALPERISLSSTTFKVVADPAQPITLTATLSRSVGQVTRGAVVQFTATRPDGTTLGWFGSTTTSNLSGSVTTSYTPGTTNYEGPVTITARTLAADGTMLTDTITLEVRPS